MNWEAIGAVGEIIGAIIVLFTLIYLARQMKQSNALMKEQASYNVLQNQLSYYDEMPIAGFRREWDRANLLPHWEEQKYIFHPKFLSFVERTIVSRDEHP